MSCVQTTRIGMNGLQAQIQVTDKECHDFHTPNDTTDDHNISHVLSMTTFTSHSQAIGHELTIPVLYRFAVIRDIHDETEYAVYKLRTSNLMLSERSNIAGGSWADRWWQLTA